MNRFELSEEQQIVRSTIAEFGKSAVRPQIRRLDIDDRVLADLWPTGVIQAEAVDGDAGARSAVTNAIIPEELGAADATIALATPRVLGPEGLSEDYLAATWFRDVRIADIYEGAGDIQRILIARALPGYKNELN